MKDRGKKSVPKPSRRRLAGSQRTRVINVSFDVTQEVAAALRALRDTGLFGWDCATVAEELLRRALLDPDVAKYWRKP
jgi:hypothetical protein